MWPFFTAKKRLITETPLPQKRRILTFDKWLEGMDHLSELGKHDVALKFWLPEAAAKAVKQLSQLEDRSMSWVLRDFLAVHCYGLYPIRLMLEKTPSVFDENHSGVKFSVSFNPLDYAGQPGKKRVDTYFVPELGKNTVPVKVWLAHCVRDDLQILADHVGIKLSQYLREIIISRLLGHGTVPKRPEMLEAVPLPAAEDWCDDKEVALRQATEDEYLLYADGKCEEGEWVDAPIER